MQTYGLAGPANALSLSDVPSPPLCLLGAPLFLSHPHFLNADPVLAEAVTGLHPNQEAHSLFLDIHPVSPCHPLWGVGDSWSEHTWLPPLFPSTELLWAGVVEAWLLESRATKVPSFTPTP